ncbi:hypothetical protein MBLNU459_g0846t1 [Dothideomycetes sp. NU459]
MSPPQPPMVDPRLLPPSASSAEQSPVHFYPRQTQPAPYPPASGHASSGPPMMYTENRVGEQSHPYYALQGRRSPSDDVADLVESDRRESAGADMLNQSPGGGDPGDPKRSRACEACRGLKVKCDMDPSHPESPCKRCAKAGRQCIVTQPSRRRQKKADGRVAELEKKIDALTAVLHAQQNGGPVPNPFQQPAAGGSSAPIHQSNRPAQTLAYAPQQHDALAAAEGQRAKRPRLESASDPRPDHDSFSSVKPDLSGMPSQEEQSASSASILWPAHQRDHYKEHSDAVRTRIQELVEPEMRNKIVEYYCVNLAPIIPAVVLPPGTTADSLLETKPTLLLGILAAGSPFQAPASVRMALTDEVVAVMASSAVAKGLKSLELIQALQVTVLWRRPNEARVQVQGSFYMWIHMAAVMALDVGLGKPFNPIKAKRGFGGPGSENPPGPMTVLLDSDTVECRRAFLVCYYLCASASQVLRRPNLLRWTKYMAECIQVLETSPGAAPTDRLLTQHIRLQRICEDISSRFEMDDPSATSISIVDPKVAYVLESLETDLQDWDSQIPEDLRSPGLMFFKEIATLYLHEIALHTNHNTDDFRVPFTEAALTSGEYKVQLTHKQLAAIEACLHAVHRCLDIFCGFELEVTANLPALLYFVRVIYALIVLIKMHVAVNAPGSELGKVIKPEDLKVQQYLERLWTVFKTLVQHDRLRPHHKAQHILGILRDWVGTHQHGDVSAKDGNTSQGAAPGRNTAQFSSKANGNDNLRLLSEAATAGADQSSTGGHLGQGRSGNWTFDSATTIPYSQYSAQNSETPGALSSAHSTSESQLYASNSGPNGAASSAVTPNSIGGFNNGFSSNDPYGSMLGQTPKQDGVDWMAGIDFEQAVDVALRDLDFSGDLFGSFFGNGAEAFQIPSDAAGTTGANGRW